MMVNKIGNSTARDHYEPVEVEVVNVMPNGMLCQSGGGIYAGIDAIQAASFEIEELVAY